MSDMRSAEERLADNQIEIGYLRGQVARQKVEIERLRGENMALRGLMEPHQQLVRMNDGTFAIKGTGLAPEVKAAWVFDQSKDLT